ncbi:MAG TPA: hypothetical protein DER33_01170 [Syntrophomonas sp.]|jgi:glutathione synthase/RimK-type ligase-like ATP-grasp enzyme|nr:hypothetical protein [Syntrophomonas sp.]HCF70199.1 hypothetical protein [Syntrophomonas sp.]
MDTQGTIYLSSSLASNLGLPLEPTINIRSGSRVIATRLVIKPDVNETYMLSPELNRALYISNRNKLQLRYDNEAGMLHIGPVIGIFSTGIPNNNEFADDSIQAELVYLSSIGRSLPAEIYVFTPAHIDWKHQIVRGFNYQPMGERQGIWSSRLYPLPDVVYDRIGSRTSESRLLVKSTKKRLMSLPYLKYFNHSFLNKWQVYRLLVTNSQLQPHLPETKLLNANNLEEMLQKYSTLFLKPSNGSLGRGIIRVTNGPRLKFTAYKRRTTHGIVGNHLELLSKTRPFRDGKPYIIQQGINLITYKQSLFDIRIIYQKNGRGEWQVAKKFVRVAPKGSSISNLSSGGWAEKLDRVFKNLYRGNAHKIAEQNHRINTMCHMVATTLEAEGHCIYGELGLDIGIDNDNFPWLIEVNSKPRKRTKTRFSQRIVRNSFKRPLEYAIYLAGFKSKTRKYKN